jgi:hypothetical protein
MLQGLLVGLSKIENDKVKPIFSYLGEEHTACFIYNLDVINDTATYEEIVNKYPNYKKAFIVTDNPISDSSVVSALQK